VTRVAVEVTGDFKYRSDRLHNPERVYYDILESRPRVENRRAYAETIDDQFLQRVRVAETIPGITRVVLDLTGALDIKVSQLPNPNRLIIELRQNTNPPTIPTAAPAPAFKQPVLPGMSTDPVAPPKPPPVVRAEARTETPATLSKPPLSVTTAPITPKEPQMMRNEAPPAVTAEPSKVQMAAKVPPAKSDVVEKNAAEKIPPPPSVETPKPATNAPVVAELGKAARHTSSGDTSLVRALGLKIGRVVIDPGHGGHDQGTEGPHGLLEKELVLDVAMRVGKLIEDRMGAEVIYTRTDDTFIPLEGRTALANEKKADLFLSIHANSSPYPRISGVETFYLNFTDSKDALDVASRENASSQKSVFELQDIIQKISLHEKLDESKEFAGRLQSSLFSLSSRNVPGQKNRGVKKAPFVVLIGASMPSVLAEIGFLTNPREEALLKKPDYRQKVADALFRGLSKYAESLSHFQVAQTHTQTQNESLNTQK
jgi:N-acetylmuramoyl-L-alanine amidase